MERSLALVPAHHFEALVAMMSEPALVAEADGIVQYANAAFTKRFSIEATTVVGRDLMKVCGLSDLSIHSNETEKNLTASVVTGSGDTETMSARLRAVRMDGEIVGYCMVFDGPEKANGRRRALEQQALKLVIEDFPYGVIIWDDQDRLYVANSRIRTQYAHYGISLKIGAGRLEILEAALRAGLFGDKYKVTESAVQAMLQRCKADRESKGTRVGLVEALSDGRWLKMTTFVSRRNWILTTYEHVSAGLPNRQDVQQLGFYYNSILQYLPDFLVHVGGHGLIEFVNDSFAHALGKTSEEVVGQPSSRHLHDALGHPMREILDRATPERPRFSYDQRWQTSSGEFIWLRWSVLALFNNGQSAGIIATGRDITVEYRQQLDLRHQSEELEKKNKSLEQFAAVVSHDLKAPLRHVSIFADMIVEETEKGNFADVASYAAQVCESAQRMDRVIKRLLEYSQIAYKIANFTRVDLAEIVIQATQNLESQIEEAKAEILLSKLPVLRGDPDLLRHLFQNLIANAVKYRRKGAHPRIRVFSTETGSGLNIYVEDNGIGIDPKFADSVFTAFQRLHKDDKVYEGFGIGLALCRQIAESHQGEMELDTNYKTGARFIVRLPHHLLKLE